MPAPTPTQILEAVQETKRLTSKLNFLRAKFEDACQTGTDADVETARLEILEITEQNLDLVKRMIKMSASAEQNIINKLKRS